MICPHCHNNIPNGSNVCPLCFSSLNGVSDEPEANGQGNAQPAERQTRSASAGMRGVGRTKPRKKKKRDLAPVIIAVGLIVVLIVFVALIVRSMFTGGGLFGGQSARTTPVPTPQVQQNNIVIFGQEPTPEPRVMTPIPAIEITPTPEPTPEPVERTYTTLKKGDTGNDVVLLQQALAQLGLLTSAADGIYGTGTMTAVRKFQQANGLDVDGIAGAKTQEVLFEMSPVTPIVESTVAPGEILDLPG